MQALFGDVPEALSNTLLIAERCSVDLDFKGYHLPAFPGAGGRHRRELPARASASEGWRSRYGDRAGRT